MSSNLSEAFGADISVISYIPSAKVGLADMSAYTYTKTINFIMKYQSTRKTNVSKTQKKESFNGENRIINISSSTQWSSVDTIDTDISCSTQHRGSQLIQ